MSFFSVLTAQPDAYDDNSKKSFRIISGKAIQQAGTAVFPT